MALESLELCLQRSGVKGIHTIPGSICFLKLVLNVDKEFSTVYNSEAGIFPPIRKLFTCEGYPGT